MNLLAPGVPAEEGKVSVGWKRRGGGVSGQGREEDQCWKGMGMVAEASTLSKA